MAFEIIHEYLDRLREPKTETGPKTITGIVTLVGEEPIAITVDVLKTNPFRRKNNGFVLNNELFKLVHFAEDNSQSVAYLLASLCCYLESYRLLQAAYQQRAKDKQLQEFEQAQQTRKEYLKQFCAQYRDLSLKVDCLSATYDEHRFNCRGSNDKKLREQLNAAETEYNQAKTELQQLSSRITTLTEELTSATTVIFSPKKEYDVLEHIKDALKYINMALENDITSEQAIILANDFRQLLDIASIELSTLDEAIKQQIFNLKDRLQLQDIAEKLFPPSKSEARRKRSDTQAAKSSDTVVQAETTYDSCCELPLVTATASALAGSLYTFFSGKKSSDNRDPNDIFNEAISKIHEKKLKSAKKLLLAAEDKGLKKPELYFWLGYVVWINNDKDLAKDYFTKVIALEPGHNFANLYLSFMDNDFEKYKLYRGILQDQYHIPIDATNFQPIPDSNYYRVKAFWQIKIPIKPENESDRLQALDYLQIALRFEPDNSQINFMTASVLLQLGRPEESIPYYEHALGHSNNATEKTGIYYELIHVLFESHNKFKQNISLIKFKDNYLKISVVLQQFELALKESNIVEEHPLLTKLKEYTIQLAKLFDELEKSTTAIHAELITKLQAANQKLNKTNSLLEVAADFAECQELLNQLDAVLEVPELNDKHGAEVAKFKSNMDDIYNKLILEADNHLVAARNTELDHMQPHIKNAKNLLLAAKEIKTSDKLLFSESVVIMLEGSYLQHQGYYTKARTYYSEALGLLNKISKRYEEQMPNIFYYRGICYLELNQYEQATNCLTIASQMNDPEIKKLAEDFLKLIPKPKIQSKPTESKNRNSSPKAINKLAAPVSLPESVTSPTIAESVANLTIQNPGANLTANTVTSNSTALDMPNILSPATAGAARMMSNNSASAASVNSALLMSCMALYLLFGKPGVNLGQPLPITTPILFRKNPSDIEQERRKTQTGGRAPDKSPASLGRR